MSRLSTFFFLALSLTISGALAKSNRFVLPSKAKVSMLPTQQDSKDPKAVGCADFLVTEKELRSMFATYHELTARQLHDDYLWAPCYVDGTVEVSKNKSFKFRVRAGNTLETNFPSGRQVILGGPATDSPSGK